MMEIAQQEAIALVSQENWDQQPENQALVAYLSRTMARYRHFD